MEKFIILAVSLVLSAVFFVSANALGKDKAEKWVVYYGEALPSERFIDYDVIAFDSRAHPALRPLQNRGKTILGYLSVGEAESYRHDFQAIKDMGVLLEENPEWPDHFVTDIRNRKWVKYLVEVKIPEILHRGFDGVMLDTLDSALYLWEKDKKKYAGMDQAAVDLLATIRRHYPKIKIMLNRGFPVLPEVVPYIDMVLAESIMVNFKTNSTQAKYFPEAVTQEYVAAITAAQKVNPDLKVYSLDYWPISDEKEVRDIYKKQRERGYVPYVTTIDLMEEHEEPK
ncbi:MAG: endo alpha-1,4 polygalactosaminidase [Rickettsiales bacterium]|nr:endo alpha-1,4 polygalactosaminidase [Rickettsiales bacterium]